MGNPSSPAIRPAPDDDELDELPDLDGESQEPDDPADELDVFLEDDASPLDDKADDETPDPEELGLDPNEESWVDEEADAADLEIGEPDLLEVSSDAVSRERDEHGDLPPHDDEIAFEESSQRALLDAGDEGPLDPDEPLRDEDLPALDADDTGEAPDSVYFEESVASDEPAGLAWAAAPFHRVGSPLDARNSTAIACCGRGALVAMAPSTHSDGAWLAYVDLEGGCQRREGTGLGRGLIEALSGGVRPEQRDLVAALQGGRLRLSRDGGVHFESLTSPVDVTSFAIGADAVWLRTRSGSLMQLSVASGELERQAVLGSVVAVTDDFSGPLCALVVGDDGQPVSLGRGPDDRVPSGWPAPRPAGTVLVKRGGWVAYLVVGGLAYGRRDEALSVIPLAAPITALTFVDDQGTLVAATYLDADDSTALVRIREDEGAAVVGCIEARREAPPSNGRTASLACDDARGVIWAAGGYGVAAFAIAAR